MIDWNSDNLLRLEEHVKTCDSNTHLYTLSLLYMLYWHLLVPKCILSVYLLYSIIRKEVLGITIFIGFDKMRMFQCQVDSNTYSRCLRFRRFGLVKRYNFSDFVSIYGKKRCSIFKGEFSTQRKEIRGSFIQSEVLSLNAGRRILIEIVAILIYLTYHFTYIDKLSVENF